MSVCTGVDNNFPLNDPSALLRLLDFLLPIYPIDLLIKLILEGDTCIRMLQCWEIRDQLTKATFHPQKGNVSPGSGFQSIVTLVRPDNAHGRWPYILGVIHRVVQEDQ